MGSVFIFVWEKYTKTTLGPFQSTPYNNHGVKKKEGGYAPIPLSAVHIVTNLDERVTLNEFNGSVVNGYCATRLCLDGINITL